MTHFEVYFADGSSEDFQQPPFIVSLRPAGLAAESADMNVFIPWSFIKRVEEWDE